MIPNDPETERRRTTAADKATTRMAAFDCMRLLRTAVPTPAIPLAPRALPIDAPVVPEDPVEEPAPRPVRSWRTEVASAAILFAVLTAGSSLAAVVVGAFFP